jgi:hypothetical protein
MTQAAANSLIPRDAPLAIVAAQDDSAAFDAPIVRMTADNVWLRFACAASASGNFKFYGSLDGTNFTQLSLPAALIVHSQGTGTASLVGNTVTLAALVGSCMIKLCGLPPYLKISWTRTGGGAAGNLVIAALASEEGDGF